MLLNYRVCSGYYLSIILRHPMNYNLSSGVCGGRVVGYVCLNGQLSSASTHTSPVLAPSSNFTASAHHATELRASFVSAFNSLATASHGLFAHSFSTSHIIYL